MYHLVAPAAQYIPLTSGLFYYLLYEISVIFVDMFSVPQMSIEQKSLRQFLKVTSLQFEFCNFGNDLQFFIAPFEFEFEKTIIFCNKISCIFLLVNESGCTKAENFISFNLKTLPRHKRQNHDGKYRHGARQVHTRCSLPLNPLNFSGKYKMGHSQHRFLYFFVVSTVNSKQLLIWKFINDLDSNRRPLVYDATAMLSEPQPLPCCLDIFNFPVWL